MGSELVVYEPSELEPAAKIETGAHVVAQVVMSAKAVGVQFPGAWMKIVGKQAKALLAEGFPPSMVVAAGWMACLRGRPELTERVAGDLQLAAAGMRMSEGEYQQKLRMYEADRKGPSLLDQHREQRAERDRARDARRAS